MSRSTTAIQYLRKTGNVHEAIDVMLGRKAVTLSEGGGPVTRQSQDWFLPDQDALQQFILRLMDKLPDASYSTGEYNNGSQGGYKVTVTGSFMDHDLASLAAVKGGVVRLDRQPGSV